MPKNKQNFIPEGFGDVLGNVLKGTVQGISQGLSDPVHGGQIPLDSLVSGSTGIVDYFTRGLEQMEIKDVKDLKVGDKVFHVQNEPAEPQFCSIWPGVVQVINAENNTFYLNFSDPNIKIAKAREDIQNIQKPQVVTASFCPSFEGLLHQLLGENRASEVGLRSLKELLDRKDLYIFYKNPSKLPKSPGRVYEPVPMQAGDINKVPFGPKANYIHTWYKQKEQSRVLDLLKKAGIQPAPGMDLASVFPNFAELLENKDSF